MTVTGLLVISSCVSAGRIREKDRFAGEWWTRADLVHPQPPWVAEPCLTLALWGRHWAAAMTFALCFVDLWLSRASDEHPGCWRSARWLHAPTVDKWVHECSAHDAAFGWRGAASLHINHTQQRLCIFLWVRETLCLNLNLLNFTFWRQF